MYLLLLYSYNIQKEEKEKKYEIEENKKTKERRKQKEEKQEEKNKRSEKKEKYGKIISTYQYHFIPICVYPFYHSKPSLPKIYLSFSTIIIHLIWENN